jgi:coenzyme F420-reducing hydrogenase gamma subunit
VNKQQLLETICAVLHGRRPDLPEYSVCMECKRNSTVCVMVAHGTPCLGPVTRAGCGALCPGVDRGCYGCFGPMERPNTAALSRCWLQLGVDAEGLVRAFRGFNAAAEPFHEESEAHDRNP